MCYQLESGALRLVVTVDSGSEEARQLARPLEPERLVAGHPHDLPLDHR
jgi:hypothetical protein